MGIEKVSANLRRFSAAILPTTEATVQSEPLHADPESIKELGLREENYEHGVPRLSVAIDHHTGKDDPRTGNTITAIGHVITAVIGAGVLSLAYSVGVLGWAAGIICLLLFAWITLYTSNLLAECHVIDGIRQNTYVDMVFTCFGTRGYVTIAIVQHTNLFLTALAYHITASTSLQAIANSICEKNGTTEERCFNTYWKWAIIFGAIQIVVVQMPDLNYFWWASIIGAAMSFTYSSIALGLSISKGNTYGLVGGIPMSSSDKAFGVLNGIGAILFAYSFSMILLEVSATLKDRPGVGVVKPMKRAVLVSVIAMTCFYLAVAISGYMAFGSDVPGNILHGFTSPHWLIDLANICIVIHLTPAYMIYSQPFLAFVEYHYDRWNCPAVLKPTQGLPFRLAGRTGYIALVSFLAICLPFFGDIVGLVGALGFWPATVFFPIECWIRVFKPSQRRIFYLRILNGFCCLVTIVAIIGSIQLIVVDSADYQVFS